MVYEKTEYVMGSRFRDGQLAHAVEPLADEVPIALEYNGVSYAVMLATPDDFEDFALGFSLTEGIVTSPSDIYGCEVLQGEDGIRIAIEIANECFFKLKEKRRNLAGRTGCGLCGTESLAQAVKPLPVVNCKISLDAAHLQAGFEQMETLQQLRQTTGATHAAAWMDSEGRVTLLREDVGRHNALDKLIGALAHKEVRFSSGVVLVSSRASYEMVSKCAAVGIGVLAAVSAPTALAVRVAKQAELTLIGFARHAGYTVYAGLDRLR